MGYASLAACVRDLERVGQCRRVDTPVDAHLELGAIQRRAFAAQSPALLFTRVKGSRFPMLANLFGTRERVRFLFRDALPRLTHIFRCKARPAEALAHPLRSLACLRTLWHLTPRRVASGPVLECRASLKDVPRLVSWPRDGGAFITLPLVYTEHPRADGDHGPAGRMRSNLGMYRVQLDGNAYAPDEVGLHYQLHRGIGPHHASALAHGVPLPVNVYVGGPPAMTLAAVMPLPENLPEVLFAAALGGRRVPTVHGHGPLPLWGEADFCLSGHILPGLKPEGPFGDHVGYYSLQHDFPVLRVEAVHHRREAIWPFTTVGRPPQEDTVFGDFIHELTGPLVPQVFHGAHEVHAVDAAGVHPLLLAVGSERYVPYGPRQPRELLTTALGLLGATQTALAKFCCIIAREDAPTLHTRDIPAFFAHVLARMDLSRDIHCITRTHTDTLDYTGLALNEGSKVIWAAAGEPRRRLCEQLPDMPLPAGFAAPRLMAPGIVVLGGPPHAAAAVQRGEADPRLHALEQALAAVPHEVRESMPLLVLVDDTAFATANWANFLWVAFSRADPAQDMYGVHARNTCNGKHWACEAPLILDARLKAWQAPPLEEPAAVVERVNALAAPGGPLHGLY